jgi:hypothetical protein
VANITEIEACRVGESLSCPRVQVNLEGIKEDLEIEVDDTV